MSTSYNSLSSGKPIVLIRVAALGAGSGGASDEASDDDEAPLASLEAPRETRTLQRRQTDDAPYTDAGRARYKELVQSFKKHANDVVRYDFFASVAAEALREYSGCDERLALEFATNFTLRHFPRELDFIRKDDELAGSKVATILDLAKLRHDMAVKVVSLNCDPSIASHVVRTMSRFTEILTAHDFPRLLLDV